LSKLIIGITGASGSIYAMRLVEILLKQGHQIHLVATDNGRNVFQSETEKSIDSLTDDLPSEYMSNITIYNNSDLFAPISSGSFQTDGMVVIPCSMSTLGEIAAASSKNLLGRAADVCLKEKRRLVLVPRETPLNIIHMKNMLTLSEAGTVILPASPGFYQKPRTLDDLVDFIVSRVLDSLGIQNDLYNRWR